MITQSLMHLDQLDPPKSPLKRGTLKGSILPFLRGAREDQISYQLLPTFSRVKGVGIDIVSIPRIAQLVERYDRHTLTLLFTPGEIDRCQAADDCDRAFAVCFATKEAVGKALGTGLVDIEWNEIEAVFTPEQLAIELYGKANIQAKQNEVQRWLASWYEWNGHILVQALAL